MKESKKPDKKKLLKELVETNIENRKSPKRKGMYRRQSSSGVITDTLNIESFIISFFIILLLGVFLYNSNIFPERTESENDLYRFNADIVRKNHEQFTISDLFKFGVSTIIIDPGHGGRDPGTVSSSGLQEKDIVLDIALYLKEILIKNTPFNIIMTRDSDETLSLSKRAAIANSANGDLFISIHLNYSSYTWFSGIETYVLGIADDTDALETASLENFSENLTVSEMNDILERIKKDFISQESSRFAGFMQKNLVESLKSYNNKLKNIGVKKAPFVVLAKVKMPSSLIEVAFLSSKKDEKLLKDPLYLRDIAEGIYRGIIEYLENED